MKLLAVFTALLIPFAAAFALTASAAQPKEDSVVLDKDGCSVDVSWVDGMEVSEKITVETIDGAIVTLVKTVTLNDVVLDQSADVGTVTAAEGIKVRARLYVEGEIADEQVTTITKCPTPTATPTSTATSVPATSTPAPAATSTPVPPIPTPIVIVQERVVTVEVPVKVSPPSTGSGDCLAGACN